MVIQRGTRLWAEGRPAWVCVSGFTVLVGKPHPAGKTHAVGKSRWSVPLLEVPLNLQLLPGLGCLPLQSSQGSGPTSWAWKPHPSQMNLLKLPLLRECARRPGTFAPPPSLSLCGSSTKKPPRSWDPALHLITWLCGPSSEQPPWAPNNRSDSQRPATRLFLQTAAPVFRCGH